MNQRGNGKMGRLTVEVELANNEDVLKAEAGTLAVDQVRRVRVPGIVDTGAARLVLPQSVVVQLGLPPRGEATVRYADQRTATRPIVRNVWLRLQGREGLFSAIVEPDRADALIGAIVLEELDLIVDCITQTLHPRDPDRIISEIE
jgi:predicted aspartyl protease